MATPRQQREALPAIWRLSDALWAEIEPILAELDPPNRFGPRRVGARSILDAIIYRGRTGCQWNRLPAEYPDDSTVHRTFQRWRAAGVFVRLWAVLIERCEDLGGCNWEWQAADAALGKARKGGTWLGRTRPTAPSVA
jgi:transposase